MENILKKKLLISDICYQMLFMFTKQHVRFEKQEARILFIENIDILLTIITELKQQSDFFSRSELKVLSSVYKKINNVKTRYEKCI
jgi:hypothetical protein